MLRSITMDESELRRQVAAELGMSPSRLRADVWGKLRERGQANDALAALVGGWDTTQVADLAADYEALDRRLERTPDRPPTKEQVHSESRGDDRRSRCLARILVAMAERDEMLRSFRSEVLPDGLLDTDEIVDWIHEEAHAQPPVRMERIVLPEGVTGYDPPADDYADWLEAVAQAAREQNLKPPVAESSLYETLAYAGPGDEWVRNIYVNPGTKLARLKAAAHHLSVRFHWREHEGVAFLLAGVEPSLSIVSVTTRRRYFPALNRIALEIDPRKPANEVSQIYASVRSDFWRVRDREMLDKHLALAVFAEVYRDSGENWTELRKRWNEAVTHPQPRWGFEEPRPEWAYGASDAFDRRFATDCRAAWSRVTGLPWRRLKPPDEEGEAS
jgi:hypothetical protein